jgi:hypothetical protein
MYEKISLGDIYGFELRISHYRIKARIREESYSFL